MQLSETAVDSGIQLTPVLTNKNKQFDEMDIMSFLRKIDSKFDSSLNELRGELERDVYKRQHAKSTFKEDLRLLKEAQFPLTHSLYSPKVDTTV